MFHPGYALGPPFPAAPGKSGGRRAWVWRPVARVGFAFLVGTGLLAVLQGLTYPPLHRCIHQQTQGHDAPRRFQEQGRGQEDRVFQETEPAFDFQTFVRQCGLIQFIGSDDKAAFTQQFVLIPFDGAGQGALCRDGLACGAGWQ